MVTVRFTRLAEADLLGIGLYTNRTWGRKECNRYLKQLEEQCRELAADPKRGRLCDEIRPGLTFRLGAH